MGTATGPIRAAGTARDVRTILVVEDEVLVRLMVAEQLRDADFHVVEAANADEALAVLQFTTDVALIVTDIRMPGSMDGLELAKTVRTAFPQIRIVLTSGNVLQFTSVYHHDAFVPKPYQPDKIVGLIKTLLN
jgi:two-component system, response regulator PdtaR